MVLREERTELQCLGSWLSLSVGAYTFDLKMLIFVKVFLVNIDQYSLL